MSEDPTSGLPPLTELVGAYETWPAYAAALRSRAERGWFYAEEAEWLAALPDVLVDLDRWKARALEAEAERDTLAELASEANEREKALEAALGDVREWAALRPGDVTTDDAGLRAVIARHNLEAPE